MNVVIAWNSGREALRAVHDAMPMLSKRASKVTLFAFSSRPERLARFGRDVGPSPGSARRRGANLGLDPNTGDLTAVEALFASLDTQDADLIVAGALSAIPNFLRRAVWRREPGSRCLPANPASADVALTVPAIAPGRSSGRAHAFSVRRDDFLAQYGTYFARSASLEFGSACRNLLFAEAEAEIMFETDWYSFGGKSKAASQRGVAHIVILQPTDDAVKIARAHFFGLGQFRERFRAMQNDTHGIF